MTHKPPQGIDAGLREALERIEAMIQDEGSTWDLSSNDKMALQIVLEAATTPDPHKDLAALEELVAYQVTELERNCYKNLPSDSDYTRGMVEGYNRAIRELRKRRMERKVGSERPQERRAY